MDLSRCFKKLLLVGLTLFLSACSMAPGMKGPSENKEKDISPAGVQIKEINAELIVRNQPVVPAVEQRSNLALQNQLLIDSYEYRVGPADVLSVTVWDHPELTIPAGGERSTEQAGNLVAADGTIYYPYAGTVKVAGHTLPEIRNILTQKLDAVIEEIKLDVRVAAYNSQRIYLVGELGQPSVQTLTDVPPTIVEMINQSGGFTSEADRKNVTLTRGGKTYRVDLLALYEDGDSSQNILLEAGDVVNVPDREANKVFVLGEVLKPGSYKLHKSKKSLAEALADAGGVDQTTSDPSQIFVVRGGDSPAIFHLDARSPEALILADKFSLQARDVVYVDTAKVVRWNRVISNVQGTVNTLNTAEEISFPLFQGNGN